VTINDVALAAGVGKATVSLSLNWRGNISTATRERIFLAARELGYSPNGHAQSLSRGHSSVVGVLSVTMFPGVHTHAVEAIQDIVTRRGYDVPQYGFGMRGTADPEYQVRLFESLRSQRPRAIICHLTPHLYYNATLMRGLHDYQESGGTVVCYGDIFGLPFDLVVIDYEDLTYRATRHLLELGHRQLGLFVAGLNTPLETRPDGFRRALAEFGIEPRPEWIFDGSSWESQGAQLGESFPSWQDRPTAMVIPNDTAAGTFINGALRAGVRIPEELSVVANFDEPLARHWMPPITTVAFPVENLANAIADYLCSRLEGNYTGEPRRHLVRGELIVRASARRITDGGSTL
jgi:DNA-binding LacI/PurR family transcriptional regulator